MNIKGSNNQISTGNNSPINKGFMNSITIKKIKAKAQKEPKLATILLGIIASLIASSIWSVFFK